MTLDPMAGAQASKEARYLFSYILRRGGSVRIGPLMRDVGMDKRQLVDAATELVERYWIVSTWRKLAPGVPKEETRPIEELDRLTTTRFGRRKYRTTWPPR